MYVHHKFELIQYLPRFSHVHHFLEEQYGVDL